MEIWFKSNHNATKSSKWPVLSWCALKFVAIWCQINDLQRYEFSIEVDLGAQAIGAMASKNKQWTLNGNIYSLLERGLSYVTTLLRHDSFWTNESAKKKSFLEDINPSRLSDAYMRQYPMPSLVPIMACRLFGAKPLSEPMLDYCQPDHKEQIWMKFYLKLGRSTCSKKCIWKCRLQNSDPFDPASVC